MKKILIVMALVLVITGCGNQKKDNKSVVDEIKCEKTIKNEDSTTTYVDTLTFEDKKIVSISSNREFSFKKSEKEDFYEEYLENIKDNYRNIEGVEATLEGKTLKIDFDVKKMNSEDIIYYIEKQDEEDLVKQYEDWGYTCK